MLRLSLSRRKADIDGKRVFFECADRFAADLRG